MIVRMLWHEVLSIAGDRSKVQGSTVCIVWNLLSIPIGAEVRHCRICI